MHSKLKLWEFFENSNWNSKLLSPGCKGIMCSDTYGEKLILDSLCESDSEYSKLFSFELKRDILEEKLLSLDLFATSKKYIIFNCEKLDTSSSDFILESLEKLSDVHLILLFKKESTLSRKLKKHQTCEVLSIEAPAFWEFDRLLNFLSKKMGLFFDQKSMQFMVDTLEPSVEKYMEFLLQVKLWFPETSPKLENVKALMKDYRLDNFEFSKLLSKKDLLHFYQKMNDANFNIEDIKGSIPFLMSHMKKLFNSNYTQMKNRLSKYDKEILASSKLWKAKELVQEMKSLASIDADSKLNPKNLKMELRKRYLKELR